MSSHYIAKRHRSATPNFLWGGEYVLDALIRAVRDGRCDHERQFKKLLMSLIEDAIDKARATGGGR
jgi:hypothetical protein